jgi:hypothetical protein
MEEYVNDLEQFLKKYIPGENLKYSHWSIEDMKLEIKQLEKKLVKYDTDIYMYNLIKSYINPPQYQYGSILDEDENENTDIDYQIFKDIEWLREWIQHNENKIWKRSAYKYDINRYENIMVKFSNLTEIYTKLVEKETHIETLNFTSNFGFLFYQNCENITYSAEVLTEMKRVLDQYEMFGYYVINRFEEYDFDLNNYGYYYIQDIHYKIDLLNLLIKHNSRLLL